MCLPQTVWALVNINTASSAELQTLTGIGTVISGRIIDYRTANGLFSSVETIKNVSGIGAVTYEKIKNDITVSGTTAVTTTTTESTSPSVPTSSGGNYEKGEKKVFIPVSGLSLTAPEIGYVNQPVYFNVAPVDGTNDRLVRYTWNFGDGSTAKEKNPIHYYAYPGTYVVTVESYYLKELKSTRYEITILPISLKVVTDVSGEVSISNTGPYEIDLQGMTLKGKDNFVFSKYTILLPGKTLTLKNPTNNPVSLYDNLGKLVESERTPINLPVVTRTAMTVASEKKAPKPIETVINGPLKAPVKDDVSLADENTATALNATVPADAWPYLGLIGLIMLGLLAVYGTKRSVSE